MFARKFATLAMMYSIRCTQISSSPIPPILLVVEGNSSAAGNGTRPPPCELGVLPSLPGKSFVISINSTGFIPHRSGSHAVAQLKARQLRTSMPTFSQKHAAPIPVLVAFQPHSRISARAPAMWFIRAAGFSLMISYTFSTTAVVAHSAVFRSGFCRLRRSCVVAVS